MDKDRIFLKEAVSTALKGIPEGGGPFGAVITMDDKIISSSYNKVVVTKDPTAHAEILAIREAARILGTHNLIDCTLYSSCEPCPMCLGAIYWSGIRKVIYAADRLAAEAAGFNDKLIYDEVYKTPEERKFGFILMPEPEAGAIFEFWKNYDKKIPY
jgi:guanine deaminase